jgi:hypothetical protein
MARLRAVVVIQPPGLASIFGAEIRLRFRAVLCLLMLAGLGSVPLLVLPG